MNLTSVTALLCAFSWISVSVSQFHTVEVQSGEEVTLMCTNFTVLITHISWLRLGNEPNASCISSMSGSESNVSYYDGFQNGKFSMSSNTTTLFLKIKPVDLSDSGLYFCGFYLNGTSVIFTATYLKVRESEEQTDLTSLILAGLIIVLILIIIVLVFIIRKLHTAHKEGQNPQHSENPGSNDLNYAALNFPPKAKRNQRPVSERKMEPNVVYAATR
ncbi:uncharacterized protein LOC121176666 [Toxotes jaculatrix]|uniref:uncharacterized protein LOC121176666 n=1 Tax=Toxotes jaculatrix TaxID=941984 RepID=UPI001B3ACE18|nr:uncharacterized protein LOC121176666 [Toxotes jaculatrix]XP_040886631.1 uncharacterized protein LOC121176666 [Toxotes jaculatrix]